MVPHLPFPLSLVLSPILPSSLSSPCSCFCGQESETAVTSVLGDNLGSLASWLSLHIPSCRHWWQLFFDITITLPWHLLQLTLNWLGILLSGVLLCPWQPTLGKMCSYSSMVTCIFFTISWHASGSECTFFGETL